MLVLLDVINNPYYLRTFASSFAHRVVVVLPIYPFPENDCLRLALLELMSFLKVQAM